MHVVKINIYFSSLFERLESFFSKQRNLLDFFVLKRPRDFFVGGKIFPRNFASVNLESKPPKN